VLTLTATGASAPHSILDPTGITGTLFWGVIAGVLSAAVLTLPELLSQRSSFPGTKR
jgi:hypothetical protein